ncbi:MAG TPA: hypothetical protein VFJ18_07255 [Pararhizobium sp.]|nr:hypothetical protein [Pararhizobium sp.]
MADFVAVIRRAVDGLSENNPENRERVYQKARSAVRRQLENMSPPPSEEMMGKQLDKLETAIGEVELEHTEALPPLEEDAGEAPPEEQAVEAAPSRSTAEHAAAAAWPKAEAGGSMSRLRPSSRELNYDAHERDHRYDFDRDEPQSYELAGEEEQGADSESWPRAEGARGSLPDELESDVMPSPFGEEPLIGEAHDEAFGLGMAGKGMKRRRKRSRSRGLIAALVAVIVVVAAAYLIWDNRTAVVPAIANLSSSSSSSKADNSAATPAKETAQPAQTEKSAAGGDAGKPAAGKDQKAAASESPPPGGKYTQRLMADGSETNPGPAPEPGQAQAGEGHSVSAQTAADAAAGAAQNQAAGATPQPSSQDAQKPAAIAQKMYLYEERFNDQAPSATTGSVVWSLAKESPGNNAPPEPAIHGEISVPDKGITALVTIKRNADKSLPASHLIEIVFALPGDFEGGGIESVQRVSLKQTEQDRGDPLIAVPAKITDNFFMVALNDYPQAVKSNIDLLKTRNWIDIPITYTNGRRALLTLEKGATGTEVFGEAMKAWAAEESASADSSAPAQGTSGGTPAPNPTSAGGTAPSGSGE